MRGPPRFSLFPYTTLFRSVRSTLLSWTRFGIRLRKRPTLKFLNWTLGVERWTLGVCFYFGLRDIPCSNEPPDQSAVGVFCRSEEHTSELQSLTNLVCRLLL